jgi:RHS repeat-associated protein
MTDRALRKTEYKYNAHKQLREIYDPEEGYTRFTSDPAGNLTVLIDPNTNSSSFGYNKDSQVTSKTSADGSTASFSYTNRRLTWSRSARGIETRYSYDKNGNLWKIEYSDATPGVTMTYDAFNRPIRIEDGLGVHTMSYDANSRPMTIDGPWADDTVTFSYDDLGRRRSVAVVNGLSVTYDYDALNRLTTVTGNGLTYTYSYKGGTNLLEKIERSDGSRTEYTYDAVMKRRQKLTNRDRTGGILNEYVYDTFDDLGQPTNETVTNGPALQFANLTAATHTYNNLNQAVTLNGSGTVFAYDADGNMTKGLTGDGRPFEAVYDAENRLVSIQYTDAAGIVKKRDYQYGADGFLGVQKDYADGILTGEQRFIRDGATVLQVRNGANAVERNYLWGLAKAGGVGALLALTQGGQTYQYYSNLRGDITAVVDSAGTMVASYAYDPFGAPLASTGTLKQPMRFSTKAYDEGTGLYDYGYRFYSPQLGRWLSRDPLSEKGSINLYSFSSNNPITKFDPFGAEDYWRAEAEARKVEREAQLAAAMKKAGLTDGGVATNNNKYGDVKEVVEKGLKDLLVEKVCGFLPVCKSVDKPELVVGKSVGLEVNDVEVVSVGGEVGVGINKKENPTPRGNLFTLRVKVEAKVLNKFGKEAEFKTEFGDMSSTGTGSRIMNHKGIGINQIE